MRRKLFVAVDFAQSSKIQLQRKMEKYRHLPVAWSKVENFHVTIAFLGYVEDERLPEICQDIIRACSHLEPTEISLDRIVLIPNEVAPRNIWARGRASAELKKIQEQVEKETGFFSRERKELIPHITLGRIRAEKWKSLSERPIVDEEIRISIPVSSLTLFESTEENGKRLYIPLEECELGSTQGGDFVKNQGDEA